MSADRLPIWFPEPLTDDPTYARRGESTTDWLRRSTVARARESRRFLNEQVNALPAAWQPILVRDLETRWKSAFFELIVARTLQVLGASLVVEPEGLSTTRIDFQATFPDGTVSVEAVAPVFDGGLGRTLHDQATLLNLIEAAAPPDRGIDVVELPTIGQRDSKREFRDVLRRLFADVPPPAGMDLPDLRAELSSGTLHLRLLPRRYGDRAIAIGPAQAIWDTSEDRIRQAVEGKRRQARNQAYPALVAVSASGIASPLDNFDRALYGREVMRLDAPRAIAGYGFEASGIFAAGPRDKDPTFAAALAFFHIGFGGADGKADPVLYHHPRYQGSLPRALLDLPQRRFDAAFGRIERLPAKREKILGTLNFVSRTEPGKT